MLVALGLSAILNAGVHWLQFDEEARPFTKMIDALPRGAKVVSMILDHNGALMKTAPYLHFAAYAQAQKGGFISSSFAKFWNVPIAYRQGFVRPKLPTDFEWRPQLYDDRQVGPFFEYLLLRTPPDVGRKTLPPSPRLPFQPVRIEPPWQLYRRIPAQ